MQIACLQNINIDIFYTINPWYSILSRWDFIHINYSVQEWIGFIGVEAISGSYFNVMGLPIQRLYKELKQL